MAELKQKDKEIEKLSAELSSLKAGSLFDDGRTVGSVRLFTAVLDGTVTADELRGMGVGKRLMNIAKEVAVKQNRRALILETQSCNTNAIGFYLHEGLWVRFRG